MPSVLEISVSYGKTAGEKLSCPKDKLVLCKFSYVFPEKGTVAFLGPSGCGKTTLFSVLNGCLAPDEGTLLGFGGKRISCVFQEDRLFPWLTALENVLAVREDVPLARKILAELGLSDAEGKYPQELSGGMRQRVSIARALAFDGDIFLLDEPFKGLDEKQKRAVIMRVAEAVSEKLVILITHDKREADAMGAEIIKVSGPPLCVVP